MRVKLDKVCKRIYAGGDVPKDRYSTVKTAEYAIPIYANAEKDNGLYGYTDTARENELSITVAARGTIGFTAIRREPFLPVVRLITVVPDLSTVSERYLYYALRNCKPASSGTSIPQLTVPDIKKNEIELYSLSVQETIADKLDAVGRVIELRQRQLQKLDELVKARFIELFGDPLSNDKGWQKVLITEVCHAIFGGGTPSKSHPEYFTGSIPWVSPKDMKSLVINDSIDHITEEAIAHSTTNLVPTNSVLMVIRSGILKHTLPVAVNSLPVTINQDMKAFVPNETVKTVFLMRFFKAIENDVLAGVRGVTADNIDFKAFQKRTIIVPPLALQEQFAAFVEQADKSKVAVQKALDEAQLLFDSLMQKYFG